MVEGGGRDCGCLVLALMAMTFVGPKVSSVYFTDRARKVDDSYFQQEPDCLFPAFSGGNQVEITGSGLSQLCVRVVRADGSTSVQFVNRLSEHSVTMCMGRSGDCDTGHYSPIPGRRLQLRPGESKEINFPRGIHYWFYGVDRKYPITITVVPQPGDPVSPAWDVVVHASHPDTQEPGPGAPAP